MVLAAIRGDKTLAELSQQYDIHANQITQWKSQLLEHAADAFATASEKQVAVVDLKSLHAKIGQLTLENDFSEGTFIKAGMLSAKR